MRIIKIEIITTTNTKVDIINIKVGVNTLSKVKSFGLTSMFTAVEFSEKKYERIYFIKSKF